jgi:8-oxo-dGTP pyrophosphatase MutT (NUDIX family)
VTCVLQCSITMSGEKLSPRVLSSQVIASTRWLKLESMKYRDPVGGERDWDTVSRSTRSGAVDAVEICALARSATKATSVLIVKQYRPPVDAWSVEFPAGLVDAGETPEQAALRELREETGYRGAVVSLSPAVSYEPGMSRCMMHFVTVDIDLDHADNATPKPELEDGEFIETEWVPVHALQKRLHALAAEPRTIVEGKVFTFASGFALAASSHTGSAS